MRTIEPEPPVPPRPPRAEWPPRTARGGLRRVIPANVYTAAEHPPLEERVERHVSHCAARLADAVPPLARPVIVLSGDYGRSEGGAVWEGDHLVPTGEYVFHVVVSGLAPDTEVRVADAVRRVGGELGTETGVSVRAGLLVRAQLGHLPTTRDLVDLAAGHRILLGDGPPTLSLRGPTPDALPPSEADRLLSRARSRLLRARAFHAHGASLQASVALDHAWLLLGDAWLVQVRCYDPYLAERLRRMEACPDEALQAAVRAVGMARLQGAEPRKGIVLPRAIDAADAVRRRLAAAGRDRAGHGASQRAAPTARSARRVEMRRAPRDAVWWSTSG